MSFDVETTVDVWNKAQIVTGTNPNEWRKDQCGAWIRFQDYGDRNSPYGWEIDHIKPVSHGGTDALTNLRPLHWENNVRKQDGSLSCPITSNGNKNVRRF